MKKTSYTEETSNGTVMLMVRGVCVTSTSETDPIQIRLRRDLAQSVFDTPAAGQLFRWQDCLAG
jgi:hypothetical protein